MGKHNDSPHTSLPPLHPNPDLVFHFKGGKVRRKVDARCLTQSHRGHAQRQCCMQEVTVGLPVAPWCFLLEGRYLSWCAGNAPSGHKLHMKSEVSVSGRVSTSCSKLLSNSLVLHIPEVSTLGWYNAPKGSATGKAPSLIEQVSVWPPKETNHSNSGLFWDA